MNGSLPTEKGKVSHQCRCENVFNNIFWSWQPWRPLSIIFTMFINKIITTIITGNNGDYHGMFANSAASDHRGSNGKGAWELLDRWGQHWQTSINHDYYLHLIILVIIFIIITIILRSTSQTPPAGCSGRKSRGWFSRNSETVWERLSFRFRQGTRNCAFLTRSSCHQGFPLVFPSERSVLPILQTDDLFDIFWRYFFPKNWKCFTWAADLFEYFPFCYRDSAFTSLRRSSMDSIFWFSSLSQRGNCKGCGPIWNLILKSKCLWRNSVILSPVASILCLS